MMISWVALKSVLVAKGLRVQGAEDSENYYLKAIDGPFAFDCTLSKNNANADLEDFETNYKPTWNPILQPLDASGAPMTSTLNGVTWATAKDLIDRLELPFIYYQLAGTYRVHLNFGSTGFLCTIPLTLSPSADQVEFETYYKDRHAMPTFSATASAAVGNSTVEGSLVGTGTGSLNIPADTLIPGSRLRIEIWGLVTTIVSPGALTLNLKLGSTVLNTFSGEPGWGLTDRLWRFEALVVCRASGVTGSVFSQMIGGAALPYELKNTAPVVIDTTVDQQLALTAQWETEDPGNSITCTNLTLESWL